MKVYVAAKFEEKERTRQMQKRLRDIGCVITHDWTTEDAEGLSPEQVGPYMRQCAINDFNGVLEADAIGYGSRSWATVLVVDHEVRDNIFFHLPNVLKVTEDEAVDILRQKMTNVREQEKKQLEIWGSR